MRYERLTRTGQGFIQPQLCHRLVAQAVLTSQFRNVQQQGREKGMHSQVLLPPLSFRPPPKTARSTLRFLSFCILASVLEFLGYPPRFRAWGQGAGREAGSWEQDAVRNATGSAIFSLDGETTGIEITRGYNVFFSGNTGPIRHISTVGTTTQGVNILSFALSGAVPTGPVTVPPHVWQPIMLYLGVPA